MKTREELIKELKKESGKGSVTLPSEIDFLENDRFICMTLRKCAIGQNEENNNWNMQENGAAFEGWAVILHAYFDKQIELDIEEDQSSEESGKILGNGHYNRFLYRALRFSQQYSSWFSLSDKLKEKVNAFDEWMIQNKGSLINNIPGEKAGDSGKTENQMEGLFASEYGKKYLRHAVIKDAEIEENDVFRQLPVGLFLEDTKNEKLVFTGGKSAIDLWTWNQQDIYMFELKSNNKMVGIITESFFYANFLNDLLVKENFVLNRDEKHIKKSERGYEVLLQDRKFKKIHAVMLTDQIHPLINEKVVEILNENKETAIQYQKFIYEKDLKEKLQN